jgi:nicotinate-nucleotide--dimethylbenzimidazole phosphoribosyltransferase
MQRLPYDDRLCRARRVLDAKAKPPGALGRLEPVAARLAALQGTLRPRPEPAGALVFAADHGVAEEGVSAYPQAVTAQMVSAAARGEAAVTALANAAGAAVEVVDVGVKTDAPAPGEEDGAASTLTRAAVRRGTRNLRRECAMTGEECDAALETGRAAVRRADERGVRTLALGDLGIGNTTAAAALLAALTGRPAAEVVGRGTGIDEDGLDHKRAVVEQAVARHAAEREESRKGTARAALASLGGLEIAALVGAMREAAGRGMAVVVDGFIVTVAALAALRMDDGDDPHPVGRTLFFAHCGAEAGHRAALDACADAGAGAAAADPLLEWGLRLGEATGAVAALPLLRSACALFEMATFGEAGVSPSDAREAPPDEPISESLSKRRDAARETTP